MYFNKHFDAPLFMKEFTAFFYLSLFIRTFAINEYICNQIVCDKEAKTQLKAGFCCSERLF